MAIKSTVGKVENSSGFLIDKTNIKIKTENKIETDRPKSSMNVGIGTSMKTKMVMIPSAKATSPRKILLMGDGPDEVGAGAFEGVSDILTVVTNLYSYTVVRMHIESKSILGGSDNVVNIFRKISEFSCIV